MTLFPVFSRRVMRQLEYQGFEVVKIAPNTKFPDKSVYYFEETAALRKAVKALSGHTNDTHNIGCDTNGNRGKSNIPDQ